MQQEWPALNQDIFDALHPFSFITDEQGIVIRAGRSFVALHHDEVVGRRFSELGVSTLAVPGVEVASPNQLIGEIFRFRLIANPSVILRGHVIQVSHEEPSFIFSLLPSIVSIDQITRLGLTIADFEVGTPLIDWLMVLRTQEIAQAQLREANRHLMLDVQMSELLQRITTDAFCAKDIEQLYRDSIRTVCTNFQWDIGHVFFINHEPQVTMVSSDIWYLSDKHSYRKFVECTHELKWLEVDEFPKSAVHQTESLWVSVYSGNHDAVRPRCLPGDRRACAVAVPVRIEGRPAAVLEFVSMQSHPFSKSVAAFFSLLGVQLGLALAHLEAATKERAQLIQLAANSKMATLGELAAGVAHEIKNPLSTIGLIVQVLKRFGGVRSQSSEMLQEQISRIDLCVDSIASIVRRLSDFSRESSSDPFSSISIQSILADALALSQPRFVARGVSLVVHPCPVEWEIDCRPSQVSQILLNLLSNAFDAVVDCAERWVTLECLDRGQVFEFVVCDSGPGIAQGVKDKIMNPFFTTKPPGVGVGLGLSISANIAATHGGSLRLDDSSPRTRFILELPKRQARPAAAA